MFKTCKNKNLHFILMFAIALFIIFCLLIPLISKSLLRNSEKEANKLNIEQNEKNNTDGLITSKNTSKSAVEDNKLDAKQNEVKDIAKDDKPSIQDETKNINELSYFFNNKDSESNVFSGLLIYAKNNNIEVKYNNNYEFGVFIESIAGVKNGDEGKYWQYYINGVLGDVAADKKILKESDVVVWRFEEAPF